MNKFILVSASALTLAIAQGAIAQNTPADSAGNGEASGALQDIIVTATRQSTNLQDTPIAITAVTSEGLKERGLVAVQDLSFVTPNATFYKAQSAFGPGVTTNIRGIASADTSLAGEATVAYYIDDVYYPILLGSNFDLLDLDHVEVLRGPQGTLFGRNALAGAVNIVSKQPSLSETSGYGEVTVGAYNRLDLRAGFNLPLNDQLALMVSGVSKERTGYMDQLDFRCEMIRRGTPALAGKFPFSDGLKAQFTANPNFTPDNCVVGHLGGEQSRAVRGSLLWQPASNIRLTITGDYTHDTSENPADQVVDIDPTKVSATALTNVKAEADYFGIVVDNRFVTGSPYQTYTTYINPIAAGTVLPTPAGAPATFAPYYNGMVTRGGDIYPSRINLKNWGVSGKLLINLNDKMDLTAVVGHRVMDDTHAFDTDGTPLIVEHTYANIREEYTSAEVRLSGKYDWADWVVGAFYFDAKGSNHAIDPNPALGTYKIQNTTYEPTSKAVFANATIRPFGEKLGIILGGRYSDDKKVVKYSNLVDLTPSSLDIVFNVTPAKKLFSWKAGLTYQPTQDILLYASVATGFQLPGFNGRPLQATQVFQIEGFQDKAYELGAKLDLFDRKLRFNVAGFYTDFGTRPVAVAGGQEILLGPNGPVSGNFVLDPLPGGPPGSTRCIARTAAQVAANVPGYACVGRTYYTNTPAKIKGFEIEASANPVEGLNISANLGYTKFTSGDLSARAVNARQNDPYWSAGGGIQYRIEAPALGGSFTPRLDWSYRSSRISSGTSTKYNYLTPPYSVFNGRISYVNEDLALTIALGATNLFNKVYYRNVFDYQPLAYPQTDAQPAPPREWYLSVGKKF